jgi:2-C-methyl-D-erythritol 4-phosphate cytidylyltransferase
LFLGFLYGDTMIGKNTALVLAAGKGVRLGRKREKAFLPIVGKPMLAWTLALFERLKSIHEVIVVVPPGREERWGCEIIEPYGITKAQLVPGGAERQDSLAKGFACITTPCTVVIIHDGARPLVTQALVDQALQAAMQHGAAVTAVPVKDTVKEGAPDGLVARTLDRSSLWCAQTPQAYRYPVLREALEIAQKDGFTATDDSALVEHIGKPVALVSGSYENIKITTPEDMILATALLERRITQQ